MVPSMLIKPAFATVSSEGVIKSQLNLLDGILVTACCFSMEFVCYL